MDAQHIDELTHMDLRYVGFTLITLLTNTVSAFAGITPLPSSPWQFEFGPRYWLSTGEFRLNLFSPAHQQVSRLTYDNWTGNAAEGFWQLSHENGLFIKGYFGGGSMDGGQLIDEDFPPSINPYSRTHSLQKNGALTYFSADLGYQLIQKTNSSLGAFIGYHYWSQQYHAFGAEQLASNSSIMGNVPPIYGYAPNTVNAHQESMTWNALRVGAVGKYMLTEHLQLYSDLAYTHSYLSALDDHMFRPDIRGIIEDGIGNGLQWDTLANYQITQNLNIGAGWRWWYVSTSGLSHFEQTYSSNAPEPTEVTQNNYGLLLQGHYIFQDGTKNEGVEHLFHWDGLYLGANLGFGTYPLNIHNKPLSTSAQISAQTYNSPPPAINVQDQGFLVGGTLGAQHVFDQLLLGIEGDFNASQISGSNAATPRYVSITTSVSNQINWLATLRGRMGKPLNDYFVPFITAGGAFAQTQMTFDMREAGVNCPYNTVCLANNQKQSLMGWTAGAGMEYSVTQKLSLKAEYLYVSFGNETIESTGASVLGPVTVQSQGSLASNLLKLGINYHI